eukprot:scaffold75263_cov44-Attheya_sp.AAC.2
MSFQKLIVDNQTELDNANKWQKIAPAPVSSNFLKDSQIRGQEGSPPAHTTCYTRLPEEVMIFEYSLWPRA